MGWFRAFPVFFNILWVFFPLPSSFSHHQKPPCTAHLVVLLTPNQINSERIAVRYKCILSSIKHRDIYLPAFLTPALLSSLETLKWKWMSRRMDCDNIHLEDCLSPGIFWVTSVRFLPVFNARVSAAELQNLSPSFSVTALAELFGNFASHLGHGIEDLLPTLTQYSLPVCPARSWHPGANCH